MPSKTATAPGTRRPTVTARSIDTKRRLTISSGVDPEVFDGLEPDPRHAWRHDNIGRLLLFAFHAFEARLLQRYHRAGFSETRQVHLNVLRHIDSTGGTRIVDLAARAGVTKGAMGQLVEECARLGLVELRADPADGRVKLVAFSKRGRAFMTATRRFAKSIEADFATLLGAERYASLRAELIDLRAAVTERSRARTAPLSAPMTVPSPGRSRTARSPR